MFLLAHRLSMTLYWSTNTALSQRPLRSF